jgi:hypothetical protein
MMMNTKLNKYGRPVNRGGSVIKTLMMFPQHLTDIIVGPHKCGTDNSIHHPPQQQSEPSIDMEFQTCLRDYRVSRAKWIPITTYGSLAVALYGIYWLGTKNKIK